VTTATKLTFDIASPADIEKASVASRERILSLLGSFEPSVRHSLDNATQLMRVVQGIVKRVGAMGIPHRTNPLGNETDQVAAAILG
jgi:hypothetical protein